MDEKKLKETLESYMEQPSSVFSNRSQRNTWRKIEKKSTRNNSWLISSMTVCFSLIMVVWMGSVIINQQPNGVEPYHYSGDGLDAKSLEEDNKMNAMTVEEEEVREFELLVNEDQEVILSADLQNVYESFSASFEKEYLRYLKPEEVFSLYVWAGEHQHYERQYHMFIDDPEYIRIFETLEDYIDAASLSDKSTWEPFKHAMLLSVRYDEKTAYITNEDRSAHFGLTKNEDGIWLVNWMPRQ
ncbi:hypothetical protein [Alkalihalobacillus pseudalcaliphilus]|uniref:hypothetical protein n=1 Tax=Alkalihalobacillus pseudalcaliphilus TaxID=79884 RepID=UPI00064DA62C|nr:hypothetical protein [Alkalihalobacillus pseudalcaliphilus]KMK75333.1 hypothetical protein AB990_18145 [Alkalihalobacillus pseudalcaliphilus]